MRRWLIAGGVGLLVLAIGAGARIRFGSSSASSGRASTAASGSSVLNVDDLMEHVDQHRRTVRVEGVVAGAAEKDGAFALIDSREFKKCGVTTCARLQLPVRWSGPIPSVGEPVEAEGEVQEWNGKLVFAARTLARRAVAR